MLLTDYCLTPDVFSVDAYGNDDTSRQEICSVYFKLLLERFREDVIIYDLHNGEWSNYINRLASKYPDVNRRFLKVLKKGSRLITVSKFSQHRPNTDIDWCHEALGYHRSNSISGIIASKNTKNNASFIENPLIVSIDKLDETSWWTDSSNSIRLTKTVDDYSAHLKLVFRHSNSLMFIDPYFNPIKFGQEDFKRFIQNIKEGIHLEFHVSLANTNKNTHIERFETIKQILQERNLSAEIFMWDDFHDRYLISNLIGINLPYGFTLSPRGKTTWTKLSKANKDDIQLEFDQASNQHRLIERHTINK